MESNVSESDVNTEDIIWLTHNNEPWTTVETKWASVLHIRQLDIKTADTPTILTKCPLLKHSLGHALVSNYISKMYLFQILHNFYFYLYTG